MEKLKVDNLKEFKEYNFLINYFKLKKIKIIKMFFY